MADDSSQGRLRKLSETYSIDLMSKTIYDAMENDSQDLSEYDGKCNNIVVHDNKEDNVKIICKKFLRYLEKSPLWNFSDPGYDVCLLLNFWVYDKLNHIFGDKNKTDVAFSNFQRLWNSATDYQRSIPSDKKCKDKFDILNKEDWKKRKELYDYYIDYDTNKLTLNFYGGKCEEYYKYIEGKKELYEYFEGLCNRKSTECPDFYEKCKEYNPNLILHKFPCHVQIQAAKNVLRPEDTSDQDFVDDPRPYGSDLPGYSAHSSEVEMTQEKSDIGTKVGKSVLGIAPIALTASALYRFTPLGPWIRKLAGSNN
ncbi:PIR Superfamily Protein, partial [Plasmodium ovale curtisi]